VNPQLRIAPSNRQNCRFPHRHLGNTRTTPIPIADDDDEENGLVRSFTPITIDDEIDGEANHVRSSMPITISDEDYKSEGTVSGSPRVIKSNEIPDSGTEDDPDAAVDANPAPASYGNKPDLTKYLRKRCLVTKNRFRVFRNGLYAISVETKSQNMPFDHVRHTINDGLPAEERFSLLEAKRVLKYMKEKLFDSLCADRVTGVDLRDVELYAYPVGRERV
jgi:hypothetical protein